MGRVLVVYGFKFRQFFGPVRHSVATLVLLGSGAAITLPFVMIIGYFVPSTPVWGSPMLPELLGAGLSAFLAFDLLFALSGGTLTHPSEIDFFTTAPLRPREYLLADLLFQFTVTDALAIPTLVFAGVGLGLRTGAWSGVVAAILAFLGFAAMGLALGQAVGLSVVAGRRGAKAGLVGLVILLMVPAGHVFWPWVPGYGSVPFPSTEVANLIHGFLFGGDLLFPGIVATGFAIVVGVAWILQSGKDVFPNLRPTMRLAFGQTDLRRTAMQAEVLTRGLSGLTRRVTVDLMKGAPLGMMTRFHLVRILRDGSLLMVALLTGMLVLIGAANRLGDAPPSDVSILTTGWAGLMIPVILSFNWNATERPNLWTVAMAPRYLGTYFRGFYRATSLVTVAAGVIGALAASVASPMGIIAALAMAIAACGMAVRIVAAVRIPSDAFSLRSLIPFLVVPPIAILAGAPLVVLSIFASGLGPSVWSVGAMYTVVVFLLFDGLPVRAARRFEL